MSGKDVLMEALNAENAAYVAEQYLQWAKDPHTVDLTFAQFFKNLGDEASVVFEDALGASWSSLSRGREAKEEDQGVLGPAKDASQALQNQEAVSDSVYALQLVRAYRVNGHLEAQLDPLGLQRSQVHPDLALQTYGFSEHDLDRPVFTGNSTQDLLKSEVVTIRQLYQALRTVYCGAVGAEFMHIQNVEQRRWLMHRLEKAEWLQNRPREDQLAILAQLTEAEAFEVFCQKKYVGTKRFGLEGGESSIVALHAIIDRVVSGGVRSVDLGMAHRGRLNTLANVVGKPYEAIFSEFSGTSTQPDGLLGAGDVKYHLGAQATRTINGHEVTLVLHPNPSHLEAVDPVVVGSVRAIQDADSEPHSRYRHMALLIHGDAAFSGQGVVYETMAMSQLIGYRTGGTIHVVINNQIGFTTVSAHAFSGQYCTDIAKSVQAPILHVNGDNPETVQYCAQLAADFRQKFAADIVLEIVCYRRHGHNEADEPSFTQPVMYQAIHSHPSTRNLYAQHLVQEGALTAGEVQTLWEMFYHRLEEAYQKTQNFQRQPVQASALAWAGQGRQGEDSSSPVTGVAEETLQKIGVALNTRPEGFSVHPKIVRQMKARSEIFRQNGPIDWATAEALAFGSLLLEGARVRLSGEDCQRGTFSQRHAVLIDQKNQNEYMPLNNIAPGQASFEVYNSLLSEFGVLGFEYGYSLYSPGVLVLWEAQFGDFSNGAQVIIDQFLASGESKWQRFSGLVMLLPHGYEGQGPEHSSARVERFLQLCAQNNIQVCMPTTPANYFHLLRRQLCQSVRKPLVVMTPKSLLRNTLVTSSLKEMQTNTAFQAVIQTSLGSKPVRRVVVCSGKVYYDLLVASQERQVDDIVLVRLEQFFPFPLQEMTRILAHYPESEMMWCQEEPQNMGGWFFVEPYLESILLSLGRKEYFPLGGPYSTRFAYAGRKAAASPAAGLLSIHQQEQQALLEKALL
ncbi:2-oxoglutarate dehydrogenase E1 component [Entomobacter blattae]|uniref:2-oxoglutarate dehydrogenase E1 component n=1 Tax=Entomobacter blattae TaxID=2762277 RepID=A0A7H1NPH0_9PROT|nr:2-oxoglutarate dehydrogenase E1 component [Entomobacter blattae]QNT77680.1 2-oxoglutarate dehydrogenase E1 component [Entomobacter blattae]